MPRARIVTSIYARVILSQSYNKCKQKRKAFRSRRLGSRESEQQDISAVDLGKGFLWEPLRQNSGGQGEPGFSPAEKSLRIERALALGIRTAQR